MSERSRPGAYGPAIIASLVADHWIEQIMGNTPELQVPWRAACHPLACVRAALDGETDPEQLGIAPGEHFDRILEEAHGVAHD